MPHDTVEGTGLEGVAGEGARLLERAFIDGFRAAADKASFLRLARIPTEATIDGQPGYKLLEVRLVDSVAVGTATPGFGTGSLVYQAFPGELIRTETCLRFVYARIDRTREIAWADLSNIRVDSAARSTGPSG